MNIWLKIGTIVGALAIVAVVLVGVAAFGLMPGIASAGINPMGMGRGGFMSGPPTGGFGPMGRGNGFGGPMGRGDGFMPGPPAGDFEQFGGPMGRGGPFGGAINPQQLLADALGITTEELQAAHEQAFINGIKQAVDKGLITQDEADQILLGEGRPSPETMQALHGAIDREALVADALGITTDELRAAHEKAMEAGLQQALDEGLITQEQADQMRAHMALRDYLDRDVIIAKALGITAEELQAARAEGKTLVELVNELGLDAATVRTAMRTARQEAIQQAVADGVITQEQADEINSHPGPHGPGGPGGRGGFGGGPHGPGGPGGRGGPGGFGWQ
jgi:lambda repressor-like predicted transcriptional regulator